MQRTQLAVHEYEQQIQHGHLSDYELNLYKIRKAEYMEDIEEINDTLNFLENRKK